MPRTKKRAQMALEEEILNNPELATKLDDREAAKEDLQPYKEHYVGLDKEVKGKLLEMELQPGLYRCGDFVVKVSKSNATHIEFDRSSKQRFSIKPALV